MGTGSFDTPVSFRFDDPDACQVVMAVDPALTVHALITAVFTGKLQTEPGLRRAVLGALGENGLGLYRFMRAGPDRVFYPRAVVASVEGHRDLAHRDWACRAGDAIADVDDSTLIDQLVDMRRLDAGHGWDPVIADPRAWLTGTAAAFTRVALAVEPWWSRTRDRLAVEQARLDLVGTAPAALQHFVNELSPEVRLEREALRIKWTQATEDGVAARINLVPMVVDSSFLAFPTPAGVSYGYPLVAASRTPSRIPTGRLEALLGSQRARVLRHLDRPRTHTELAEHAAMALSTTTHHVNRLRASGLVVTLRLSRTHWVLRTSAGEDLLHLLE